MANHLEGLASHYEQMRGALEDKEAGIEIAEEDLEGLCVQLRCLLFLILPIVMNRDTDELPSIISELEQDIGNVKSSQ